MSNKMYIFGRFLLFLQVLVYFNFMVMLAVGGVEVLWLYASVFALIVYSFYCIKRIGLSYQAGSRKYFYWVFAPIIVVGVLYVLFWLSYVVTGFPGS